MEISTSDNEKALAAAVGLGWALNDAMIADLQVIREQYNLPPNAILDPGGTYVYMKYKAGNHRVEFKCGEMTYLNTLKNNINMILVQPEHVPCAMGMRGGCCGNKKPGVIIFANPSDVRRWTQGGR